MNVLLAFLDRQHASHDAVVERLPAVVEDGWATCPLTQNGFLRIISQERYAAPISTRAAVDVLAGATAAPDHRFIPDDVTLLDASAIDHDRLLGPAQLTDVYLLALAVSHGGRLVTSDRRVPTAAVLGAGDDALLHLGT